jgi:uncharacterized membrane protein
MTTHHPVPSPPAGVLADPGPGPGSRARRESGSRPVAIVLRVGGILGAVLVLAGLVASFAQGDTAWLHGQRSALLGGSAAARLSDLPDDLRHARPTALTLLGMLVLAATPAAGVAAAGITWLAGRQLRLAAVAAVVLLLLTAASVLGAAG